MARPPGPGATRVDLFFTDFRKKNVNNQNRDLTIKPLCLINKNNGLTSENCDLINKNNDIINKRAI